MLPIRHSLPAWRRKPMPHTGNAISTPPKGIGLALKAVGNMADRILAFSQSVRYASCEYLPPTRYSAYRTLPRFGRVSFENPLCGFSLQTLRRWNPCIQQGGIRVNPLRFSSLQAGLAVGVTSHRSPQPRQPSGQTHSPFFPRPRPAVLVPARRKTARSPGGGLTSADVGSDGGRHHDLDLPLQGGPDRP